MPHSSLKLCAVSATLLLVPCFCLPARARAQSPQTANSVHPITSLPKAPNDPTRMAQPMQSAQPVQSAQTVQSTQTPAPETAPAALTAAPAADTTVPAADTAPAAAAFPSSSTPVTSEPPAPAPAPVPVYAPAPALQASVPAPAPTPAPRLQRHTVRPFSTVAIAVNFGTGGVGGQLAVPLSQTFNARVGADFFSYSTSFTDDGLQYGGDLKFRTANFNLDWFPFHNGFRLSPGITLYNGNNLNANVLAPGGQVFSLADANYYSLPTDPVHGSASLTFGNRTAPQITTGFGNMIPRSGRHFSVPFEIGFQYLAPPIIQLHLQGTACGGSGVAQGCVNAATDPTVQANLMQEQNELNSDIHGLRFYPVVRLGLSYKF